MATPLKDEGRGRRGTAAEAWRRAAHILSRPPASSEGRLHAITAALKDFSDCALNASKIPPQEVAADILKLVEAITIAVGGAIKGEESHQDELSLNTCKLITELCIHRTLVLTGPQLAAVLPLLRALAPGPQPHNNRMTSMPILSFKAQKAAVHAIRHLLTNSTNQLPTAEITSTLNCLLQWAEFLPSWDVSSTAVAVPGTEREDRDSYLNVTLEALKTINQLLSSASVTAEDRINVLTAVAKLMDCLGAGAAQPSDSLSSRVYATAQRCAREVVQPEVAMSTAVDGKVVEDFKRRLRMHPDGIKRNEADRGTVKFSEMEMGDRGDDDVKAKASETHVVHRYPNPEFSHIKQQSDPKHGQAENVSALMAGTSTPVKFLVDSASSEDLVVEDDECILKVGLHEVDTVDTRPWLLSKHCMKFFTEEFGVSIVCKEVAAKEGGGQDAVHAILSKRIEEGWKAFETKWFVNVAADFLRSIATRGLCSRRLAYEGPLSRHPAESGPSVKEVARKVAGEDRINFEKIEEETGVMLKLAQAKSGPSEEEKRKGSITEDRNFSSGSIVRIVVRLRAINLASLFAAERLVKQLLDDTADYFTKGAELPAHLGDQKVALPIDSKPLAPQKRASSPHSEPKAGGSPERHPAKRMRRSRSPPTQEKPQAAFAEPSSIATKAPEVTQEAADIVEAPISDIPTTRILHVTCGEVDETNLSEELVKSLFDSVLTERLEVPKGLLESENMVLSVTQLDRFLCVVELAHEQLAGACVELLAMEPDVFQGLSVQLGPGGDILPTDVGVTVLAVSELPETVTVDKIYNIFHEALQIHATSVEKSRARKLTMGKLISTVRYEKLAETAWVYLPTPELADRALAIYERDPQVFSGMLPKLEKKAAGIEASNGWLLDTGGRSKSLRKGTSGSRHEGPTSWKEEPRVEKPFHYKARLEPNRTVYVQRLQEDMTDSAIGFIVKRVLLDNVSPADLDTAVGGDVVGEVRRVRPYCAFIALPSQRLTMRVLELYKKNPAAFKGMEVKPHKGSKFDVAEYTAHKEPRQRRPEGRSWRDSREQRAYSSDRYHKDGDRGMANSDEGDYPLHGSSHPSDKRKLEDEREFNGQYAEEAPRRASGRESLWSRPRVEIEGEGSKDGFVRLDRERCVYAANIPQPLDEVQVRTVFDKVLREELGKPNASFVSRVKQLKGCSAFVEFESGKLVNLVLRAYEDDSEPKKRFQGMVVRRGAVERDAHGQRFL